MSALDLLDVPALLRGTTFRNIPSLRVSQDLSDDLVPGGRRGTFNQIESDTKRRRFGGAAARRPFEAGYNGIVMYPFEPPHWSATRFSDGSFGVWYGSLELNTTIYETAYHVRADLLTGVDFPEVRWPFRVERRVHAVEVDALLFDVRGKVGEHPWLVDRDSYTQTQLLGREVSAGGHPGLLARSARCDGDNAVLFSPEYLGAAPVHCFLTYELDERETRIEREPGVTLLRIPG